VLALWVDRRGTAFFDSGKEVVTTLDAFAAALPKGDAAALARFYASDFTGTRLGLTTRDLADEKDGARHYRQRSDGAAVDAAGAVAECRAYRDSFASIEEAGLHLDQLEQWSGDTLGGIIRA